MQSYGTVNGTPMTTQNWSQLERDSAVRLGWAPSDESLPREVVTALGHDYLTWLGVEPASQQADEILSEFMTAVCSQREGAAIRQLILCGAPEGTALNATPTPLTEADVVRLADRREQHRLDALEAKRKRGLAANAASKARRQLNK